MFFVYVTRSGMVSIGLPRSAAGAALVCAWWGLSRPVAATLNLRNRTWRIWEIWFKNKTGFPSNHFYLSLFCRLKLPPLPWVWLLVLRTSGLFSSCFDTLSSTFFFSFSTALLRCWISCLAWKGALQFLWMWKSGSPWCASLMESWHAIAAFQLVGPQHNHQNHHHVNQNHSHLWDWMIFSLSCSASPRRTLSRARLP